MAVKVADLIEDLETGDRSTEHLKKPEQTPESMVELIRDQMNRLMGVGALAQAVGGGLSGGSLLSGFAGLANQQNAMNQQANQNMANQQAMGNVWHAPVKYKL